MVGQLIEVIKSVKKRKTFLGELVDSHYPANLIDIIESSHSDALVTEKTGPKPDRASLGSNRSKTRPNFSSNNG